MKTYKAPDNSLHAIEPEFAHMLPAGCVEITEEEADALRVVVVPHEVLAEQTLAWARALRLEFFKILDGLQVSAVVQADMPTAVAIESAKQALRDITTAVDLAPYTTFADMQQALIYAYCQIRETVPQNVKSAFDSLVP